ncbi:MAG: MarR family transcriptional regulator [Pseudomonadota bacterium]
MIAEEKEGEAEAALESLTNGQCIALALRKATRRISRAYDEALSRHNLTIGQLGILAAIASRAGTSVQELADFFDMNQSAMSRTLKPLVRDGLLEDKTSDEDRRRRGLYLTASGEERLHEAARTWQNLQKSISHKSALDIEQLLALLRGLDP